MAACSTAKKVATKHVRMPNNKEKQDPNLKEHEDIDKLYARIPKVHQHFEVLQKIGSGTFSSVYKAVLKGKHQNRKTFALKHIVPTSHPERILYELQCMQTTGGVKNVVTLETSLMTLGHVVLVMPFFPHRRLQDDLLNLTLEESCDYLYNLLVALRHIHQYNIIHRDVKPANFLYNCQERRYLLIDFGLAEEFTEENKRTLENHYIAYKERELHSTSRARHQSLQDRDRHTQPPSSGKEKDLSRHRSLEDIGSLNRNQSSRSATTSHSVPPKLRDSGSTIVAGHSQRCSRKDSDVAMANAVLTNSSPLPPSLSAENLTDGGATGHHLETSHGGKMVPRSDLVDSTPERKKSRMDDSVPMTLPTSHTPQQSPAPPSVLLKSVKTEITDARFPGEEQSVAEKDEAMVFEQSSDTSDQCAIRATIESYLLDHGESEEVDLPTSSDEKCKKRPSQSGIEDKGQKSGARRSLPVKNEEQVASLMEHVSALSDGNGSTEEYFYQNSSASDSIELLSDEADESQTNAKSTNSCKSKSAAAPKLDKSNSSQKENLQSETAKCLKPSEPSLRKKTCDSNNSASASASISLSSALPLSRQREKSDTPVSSGRQFVALLTDCSIDGRQLVALPGKAGRGHRHSVPLLNHRSRDERPFATPASRAPKAKQQTMSEARCHDTELTECHCGRRAVVCDTCLSWPELKCQRGGTPGFRSPEVLMKFSPHSTGLDVWAAGVVFLSLLSKRYPFFQGKEDLVCLAEIVSLLGTKLMVRAAEVMDKDLLMDTVFAGEDLELLCADLRLGGEFQESLKKLPPMEKKALKALFAEWKKHLPKTAFDLLRKLLDPNPFTRITASDALQHPYFKRYHSPQ